jgi:hypothetical protein
MCQSHQLGAIRKKRGSDANYLEVMRVNKVFALTGRVMDCNGHGEKV